MNEHPSAPPFCTSHLLKTSAWVSEFLAVYNSDLVASAPHPAKVQSVVYYVRLGRHIKIGTTTDIAKRVSAFLTVVPSEDVELLATEPGAASLEHERHRQFADERIDARRELFNPSRRLLSHIASLTG